jgi:hypothetical protein
LHNESKRELKRLSCEVEMPELSTPYAKMAD